MKPVNQADLLMNRKSYLAAYRAPNVSRFLTQFEQTRRNGVEQREDKRLGLLKKDTENSSADDLCSHPQQPTRKVHKISRLRLRQVQKLRRDRANSTN